MKSIVRMVTIVAAAALCAASAAPQQQGQQAPAAGGGADGEGSGGSGGGGCGPACQNLANCGMNSYENCMASCQSNTPTAEELQIMATARCDELQTYVGGDSGGGGGGGGGGIYETEGQSCVGGDNTCQGVTICCAPGGGQAPQGINGSCRSAPSCNAPRR